MQEEIPHKDFDEILGSLWKCYETYKKEEKNGGHRSKHFSTAYFTKHVYFENTSFLKNVEILCQLHWMLV